MLGVYVRAAELMRRQSCVMDRIVIVGELTSLIDGNATRTAGP